MIYITYMYIYIVDIGKDIDKSILISLFIPICIYFYFYLSPYLCLYRYLQNQASCLHFNLGDIAQQSFYL